jgi:Na+-translocating ferredoxin:NAD+ oxidoreductase RnfG subunit
VKYQWTEKDGNNNLRITVTLINILLAISVICILGLSGCDTVVLENDSKMLTQLQQVYPEASFYKYDEEIQLYYVYDSQKKEFGYAFYAEGWSYTGEESVEDTKYSAPMTILVGLKDKNTIAGISVISESELAQFWQKLINTNYLDQFIGLKIESAYFTRNGGLVNSVTGATLSAASVLDIVREAALEKAKLIR